MDGIRRDVLRRTPALLLAQAVWKLMNLEMLTYHSSERAFWNKSTDLACPWCSSLAETERVACNKAEYKWDSLVCGPSQWHELAADY